MTSYFTLAKICGDTHAILECATTVGIRAKLHFKNIQPPSYHRIAYVLRYTAVLAYIYAVCGKHSGYAVA